MGLSSPAQPRSSWSSLADHGHGVQFYASDDTLTALLTGYVGTALVSGDAAIVVATASQREALIACLRSRGFDPEIAAGEGRYVALDAAETLAKCSARGQHIDVVRFNELMGTTIEQARAATGDARSRVAVFGEMISLMAMTGQAADALQLEELWNRLLRVKPFSLCCAYPMKMFDSKDAAPFLRICAQHSHVFPTEQRRPSSTRFFSWPAGTDVAADSR